MKCYKRKYLVLFILVIIITYGFTFHRQNIATDINNQISKDKLYTLKVRSFNKGKLKKNDKDVPVIMYHYIRDSVNNSLVVTPQKFDKQMKYLFDNGYTTLTMDELYSFNGDNMPIPKKSVVITFDDGYRDNYENAYPILKKYHFNATIFVITDSIDNDNNMLTSKQLIEMSENGIDIESHTTHHKDLKRLSYDEQLTTMINSKKVIEGILKKPVKYLAYPNGSYNEDSIKACKKAGYIMGVRTHEKWSNKRNGIFSLNRIYVNGNNNMSSFTRRINDSNYHFMGWRIFERITR